MTDANPLDPKMFDELLTSTGGDPAFVNELIDTYFVDAPKLIAAMRSARAANNTR